MSKSSRSDRPKANSTDRPEIDEDLSCRLCGNEVGTTDRMVDMHFTISTEQLRRAGALETETEGHRYSEHSEPNKPHYEARIDHVEAHLCFCSLECWMAARRLFDVALRQLASQYGPDLNLTANRGS
jgi:hypothetical protein